MVKFFPRLILGVLLLLACKGGGDNGGGGNNPPPQGAATLTGVWTGLEGPLQSALTPTARLELIEDGGYVTGVWYSSDVFPDAGSWPVGAFTGTRDGGFVFLRDVQRHLPDGGLADGYVLTGTFTPPNHFEGAEIRTKRDGGPLPIYFKVDRTQ
jgi:hypothetical protein